MAEQIKLKPVESKTKTATKTKLDNTELAERYTLYKEMEKKAKAEIELLKVEVKTRMGDKDYLKTDIGTFRLETRRTPSWKLDKIKKIFGSRWTSFVIPDPKLIKARIAQDDKTATQLEKAALIGETVAVTFR